MNHNGAIGTAIHAISERPKLSLACRIPPTTSRKRHALTIDHVIDEPLRLLRVVFAVLVNRAEQRLPGRLVKA